MNIGKINVKNQFSAVKNKIKRGASLKSSKGSKLNGSGAKSSAPQGAHRSVRLQIPIGLQTVVAVLVCCGVLVLVGFGLLTAEQQEINSLKGDLKTYADDGVVPAGSMDDSVSLNIESVAGRIDALQKVINGTTDDTVSNEDLQWLGSAVDEVTVESQMLNDILKDVKVDRAAQTAYNDMVQSPLLSLQQSYDALNVQDSDVADTAVDVGAASDTGAFKTSGKMETETKWGIFIAVVIAVIAVVLVSLFRRKIAAFFSLLKKNEKRAGGRSQSAHRPSGSTGKRLASSAGAKGKPLKNDNAKSASKDGAKPAMKEEKAKPADAKETPLAGTEAPSAETFSDEAAMEKDEIDENEAFWEQLAPALRKHDKEEAPDEEKTAMMAEPLEEDLMTFDDSIATQDDIEEEEDLFFTKEEEPPKKRNEER